MEQRPRILPVLVGTSDRRYWSRLAEQSRLHEIHASLQDARVIPDELLRFGSGPNSNGIKLAALREVYGEPSSAPQLVVLVVDPRRVEKPATGILADIVVQSARVGMRRMVIIAPDRPTVAQFQGEIFLENVPIVSADEHASIRRAIEESLQTSSLAASDDAAASNQDFAPPSSTPSEPAATSGDDLSNAANDDDLDGESESRFLFDDLNENEFSPLAWKILSVARRLGEGRPRPDATSVRRLLTSIVLSSTSKRHLPNSGVWLLKQTTRDQKVVFDRLCQRYHVIDERRRLFDSLLALNRGVASTMSRRLREVIDLARRLATESRRVGWERAEIGARHLLGATLERTETSSVADKFLRGELGLDVDVVRDALIAELPVWNLPDDPQVWRRLLDPVDSPLDTRWIPTYATDSPAASVSDCLDIRHEVEAMAALVSAWSIEPPLSIGLFGEWGSGKSFFMHKMKERVRMLSQAARGSKQGQRSFGYYKNIVQVEFNAWHYVEGNLWASLVEHIFANLRLEGHKDENVDTEENIAKRLARLLSEVREKTAEAQQREFDARALTRQAEERKTEAETKAAQLEQEAKTAIDAARTAESARDDLQNRAAQAQREADANAEELRKVTTRDLLDEIENSQHLRDELRTALAQVGITGERLATLEELRSTLREASSAATVIVQGFDILRKDRQRWWLLAWALIVPAALVAITLGIAWLAGQQDAPWMQTVLSIVSGAAAVAGLVASAWRKYSPQLSVVFDAVEKLKEQRRLLEARVETARAARSDRVAELEKQSTAKEAEAAEHRRRADEKLQLAERERREAATKQVEATAMQARVEQARQGAERLAEEADRLRPERRIATFIQDRAAATDYRRHLGIPAIVRRDFAKLEEMFRTQRLVEERDEDGLDVLKQPLNDRNDPSVVNRIILYIDDLDRCPPQKVVEVLQAIHLLLAFPLFVVIVAVDARWMKRSLRQQFRLMLSTAADPSDTATGLTASESETHMGSTATPDDYLEKLFQVPFWIRPLGPTASKKLVEDLTRNDVSEPPSFAEPTPAGPESAENVSVSKAPIEASNDVHVAAEPPTEGAAKSAVETPARNTYWSPIEARPRALQLSSDERSYMIELAGVIGRSPRSVKRFVNCYRLAKMTLEHGELERQKRDDTFRATMLLLGIVAGLPELAPEVIGHLRRADGKLSSDAWTTQVTTELELDRDVRWNFLVPFLRKVGHEVSVLAAAADHVERFSFSPTRDIARTRRGPSVVGQG